MILGPESDFTPTGSFLFNSAQLVHDYFNYLCFCDRKMAPDRHRNNGSRLKQGGERKEGN
jgi:hypothetical protein